MQYGITRACQIIIGGGTYSSNCSTLKLDSIHTRRQQQTKRLFNQIANKPEHCLHFLLPTAREQSVTDRLRSANKLPRIFAKTNRYKNSVICYSLNSLPCEWCLKLFVWLCNPAFELPYNNKLIGWLIDWLIDWLLLPATRQRWQSRLYPAEAGTRLSDPGGMQGLVDLVGLLHTEIIYPPEYDHPSKYYPGPTWINFVHATNSANHYATTWLAWSAIADRESDRGTRWIKEAVQMGKEGRRSMNRDKGSYTLSHTYDRFLATSHHYRSKNRKKNLTTSSNEGLW